MSGTITHSWNGTVLTVTSDSGTSSADLKGDKGIRGAQGAPGVVDASLFYTTTKPPTAAEVGAAPAGFGLGGFGKAVNSPDDAKASGFYFAPAPTQIASAGNMRGIVVASSAVYLTQFWTINGYVIKRELNNNVFGEYEWLNPPYLDRVEYLTTERFNGKKVYTMLLNLGTAKGMGFNASVANRVSAIIRAEGTIAGLPMPIDNGSTSAKFNISFDSTTVNFSFTQSGYNDKPVFVRIWYTKD